MSLSSPFIRRPVGTTLLTLAVAMAGAIAYTVLPVAPLPQVEFPTINVGAGLPGASAETMAASVATPLERQFSQIAGVTEMTSSSTLGNASITLQFDLSRDIDGAARDVQAAINAARTYLPANLPSNPHYFKQNPAAAPIMILGLTSNKYDVTRIYDVASTTLVQKISQIDGVGQVDVGGGATLAVRVEVDPTKLESYGLTLGTVESALRLQNSHEPTGQLTEDGHSEDILTNDQISQASQYKPLIVGYHNGAAVRLEDVAEVVDSTQNIRTAGFMDGQRAVLIIIRQQPGANIIDTVDRIKQQLPFLEAVLPKGVNTTVVMDRSTTIRASVHDVELTLLGSVILVVLVVFFFLRSPRATLIPSVAVPVSLIGTFAVMYLFGYSIDNLSLMALTIATGFVVDDAIVVMENITRHLEAGMDVFPAALKGAKEIGFTVLSMSSSLIAVFIPILMMGGIVGRLFREFAMVLSTAIAVSLLVSLTTTPCMCAHLLKTRHEGEHHNWMYRASEKFFNGMLAIYRRSLVWVLDNPLLMLIALLLTIALNVVVMYRIPKGFFPMQDTGLMMGGVQGPQDASFPIMRFSLLKLVNVIKADPAVAHVMAFSGGRGSSNGGFLFVSLKPLGHGKGERSVGVMQVINRLRPKLDRLPLASAFMQPGQELRIGGRGGNALYQYTIQAENVSELAKWGPILLEHMRRLPGITDANSDYQSGGLDLKLNYDRVTMARLGQTPQSLNSALYAAFGQSQSSVIFTPLNQYYVVTEVAPRFWESPAGLHDIYFTPPGASGGAGINAISPLSTVLTAKPGTTPLEIDHTGLFPSVTVSFNLGPGMALSDATREINQMEMQLGTPSTVHGLFSGTMQAYQKSLSSEPILIFTALLAVFIVLGMLYESLVHPLTIISTLPSASVGAMIALMVFHIDLNVISIIGIILLIGIVKKNAIMMIDFALQAEREEGKETRDAIFEACMLRFRPIMMTTMAAICGSLPLAFGSGMGSELRRPLGITIVGGLVLSQLLTLYTTPVVYLYMDRLRLWSLGKVRGTLPSAAEGVAS
ncbi:MAG TPA: efflux RND transporter permease subunit [Terracidiphilus sp.]|nr:efflux RND transporter permease subunit [Terracidiphilus sp.]